MARVVTAAVVELDCSLNNGAYQSCISCSKSLYMVKPDCSLNNGSYQSCISSLYKVIVPLTMVPIRVVLAHCIR